jgi:predicted amidohydrolase
MSLRGTCVACWTRPRGADLVLFPELFTVELFTTFPDWKDAPVSELTRIDRYTQDYRDFFKGEARERSQFVVAGSHLMKDGGRYLNVGHLYEPDGTLHVHAKTHIFPAEADWSTEEGDTIEAIDLPFAKVGFNICYEAEIPECAATLAQQGAEIILCPSFTFTSTAFGVCAIVGSQSDREPALLRALLHRRAAGCAAAERLGPQLDSQPVRPPVEPERHRRGG